MSGSFTRVTLPVLILHGTNDKTLKLYERRLHDLLSDGREQVMADIQGWIGARLPTT